MNNPPGALSGLPLETKINSSRHESGGVAIWYLGQVGFLLQHSGLTIAIDPYLTDSIDRIEGMPKDLWVRNYPPPVLPEKLRGIDLVLCTHDHLDHTDPETLRAIAAASPGCQFAGPRASVDEIKKSGIAESRTLILNEGKKFFFRDVLIEPVAAAHEDYDIDPDGYHRYLGYLLHWKGLTLFHSGDTIVTPQLCATLSQHRIDVGFLPINGADATRRKLGIVGNMNAVEAVTLATEQRFDLVIPTHYDLYPNNGAALADFVTHWERQPQARRPKFKAFQPGESIVYRKADRSRPLAVILGAGKTGRGFLARLLNASPYEMVFVERDEKLVRQLNGDGGYTVHFFGGERTPHRISGAQASLAGSEEALAWMCRAAVIFTAVGDSNVGGLVSDLQRVLERRRSENAPKLRLLVCENGASPAAPLRQAFVDFPDEIEIAEAAIFCSTIELPGTRLDIQSEAYDELPYDSERLSDYSAFAGMKPVADFPTLLKRKIYTYNCFSACIAYLGAYKKYQGYADAARDVEISVILDWIAEPLNQAITRAFHVAEDEQQRFSSAALRKFKDPNICDDIARNARDVMRKLSPDDRLVAPARFILENGGEIKALALTMAAALLYRGPDEKRLQTLLMEKSASEVFAQLSGCSSENILNRHVTHYYELLKAPHGRSILEILEI